MIFLLVFFLAVSLGAATAINFSKYNYFSIVALLVYPSSTALSSINLYEGVYYYDGFFAGLVLGVLLSNKYRVFNFLLYKPAVLVVIFMYVIYAMFAVGEELKYLLKDIRPIILVIEVWIYTSVVKANDGAVTDKQFFRMACIISIASVVKLLLVNIGLFGFSNEFYEENKYRYLDAGTYFCALYLVYYASQKRAVPSIYHLVATLSLLCVLLSNSRFLILSLIAAVGVMKIGSLIELTKWTLMAVFSVVIFISASFYLEAERVLNALNYEMLGLQILSRYSPFFDSIQNFHWYNYIVGGGLGNVFYIPWFEYRADMSVYNSNIDSFYLTYYAKFGLLFLLYYVAFLRVATISQSYNRFDWAIAFFCSLMFVVSATPYQIYAVGIPFAWCFMSKAYTEVSK